MSEQSPEFGATGPRKVAEGEYFEKSLTGSAQSINVEPSENFVPPTMSVDAYELPPTDTP